MIYTLPLFLVLAGNVAGTAVGNSFIDIAAFSVYFVVISKKFYCYLLSSLLILLYSILPLFSFEYTSFSKVLIHCLQHSFLFGILFINIFPVSLPIDCTKLKFLLTCYLFSPCVYFLVIILQYGLLGRPSFPFLEPSLLGLYLFSLSSATFWYSLLYPNQKHVKLLRIYALVLSAFGGLTMSTHFVTFIFSNLVLFLFIKVLPLLSKGFVSKKTITFFIYLVPVFGSFCFFMFSQNSISSRINGLFDISLNNLSSLSYMNSMLNAYNGLFSSFGLGYGAGSLGFIKNLSNDFGTALLEKLGYILNIGDGYSLFLRVLTEMGLLGFILLMLIVGKYLSRCRDDFKNFPIFFPVRVFGFCLFLGALFKEPTLTLALQAISCYILILKPTKAKYDASQA